MYTYTAITFKKAQILTNRQIHQTRDHKLLWLKKKSGSTFCLQVSTSTGECVYVCIIAFFPQGNGVWSSPLFHGYVGTTMFFASKIRSARSAFPPPCCKAPRASCKVKPAWRIRSMSAAGKSNGGRMEGLDDG